jgi:nucleoside-diphosphate-sugar epimerase
MGRLALITGATGFVGGHLAERLAAGGWAVRALVRPTSETTRLKAIGAELSSGDLSDVDAIRRAAAGADVVYHLAATTFARTEQEFARANVEGTANVARAVMDADPKPRRLVYLSSYAACGPAGDGAARGVDETPAPLTAYGRTKLAGEAEVRAVAEAGVEHLIVRAPAVFGPGDRALLSYFRLVKWGVAPSPAGGGERLHLIYGPDLAAALARGAEGIEGTVAVADPVEHRWSDVVDAIADAMGRRPLRVPLPAPLVRGAARVSQAVFGVGGRAVPFNPEKAEEMLARAWICDLTGSASLLDHREVTPLAEAVSRTVAWYKREGWL